MPTASKARNFELVFFDNLQLGCFGIMPGQGSCMSDRWWRVCTGARAKVIRPGRGAAWFMASEVHAQLAAEAARAALRSERDLTLEEAQKLVAESVAALGAECVAVQSIREVIADIVSAFDTHFDNLNTCGALAALNKTYRAKREYMRSQGKPWVGYRTYISNWQRSTLILLARGFSLTDLERARDIKSDIENGEEKKVSLRTAILSQLQALPESNSQLVHCPI